MSFSKRLAVPALFLALAGCIGTLAAQSTERSELDNYRFSLNTNWWFSNPSGFFRGAAETDDINIHRDLGFGSYSTFSGRMDWHMTRRQHLIAGFSPVLSDRTTTLQRTIEYEGNTYDVGVQVKTHIQSLSFSPGYQFDFIRRNGSYLAFATQCFLLNTEAKISGQAVVDDHTEERTSSGSAFSPLPVVGLQSRWYPSKTSSRFSLDGFWNGMYFFGYGDFMSAGGTAGVRLSKHMNIRGGYQMGTRLSIKGSEQQIGIRLVQKGPVAGLESTW